MLQVEDENYGFIVVLGPNRTDLMDVARAIHGSGLAARQDENRAVDR